MPTFNGDAHSISFISMSFNFTARMMDVTQIPVLGKLLIEGGHVSFYPSPEEDQSLTQQFESDDVKYISFQDVGYRAEEGPFFEVTFYFKEVGRVLTFGDFPISQKDDLGAHFEGSFGIQYQEKALLPYGWTWGTVHIDSRVIALMEPDDLEDSDVGEEGAEPGEEGSEGDGDEPIGSEFFHFPTQLVIDYQKIAGKDLQIELAPSGIKSAVYVRSLTLGFPTEDERDCAHGELNSLVQQVSTDRMMLIENIQLFQPAGKYGLELGRGYFKFVGNKEFRREGKDVTRLYLLERSADQFFLIIQLQLNKRVNDHEMVVAELTSKREHRDFTLPDSPEDLQKLKELLSVKNYARDILLTAAADGDDLLYQLSNQEGKSHQQATLRSVPQFMAVLKFLQYICPGASVVMSPYAQEKVLNKSTSASGFSYAYDDAAFSFLTCGYKRPNREYFLYPLQKHLLVLPMDCAAVPYGEIRRIIYTNDIKNTRGDTHYVKITLQLHNGKTLDFTKVSRQAAVALHEYLRNLRDFKIDVRDDFEEFGNRVTRAVDNDEEDENDEEWNEEEDEPDDSQADAHYEYSSGESAQDVSEQEEKHAKPEKKGTKADKKPLEFEEVDLLRPEDALREVGMPMEWAGGVAESSVEEYEATGNSD